MSAGIIIGGSAGGVGSGGSDSNAVKKTGDTMTGTLEIDDPGGAGNALLQIVDATNSRFVRLLASGTIYMNSGAAQTGIIADGAGNLTITGLGGIVMCSGFPATTKITVDYNTGDVIATQLSGPNVGKNVNLTAGKWV